MESLGRHKMSGLGRHNLCCDKTRSLLWQHEISLVPRHEGGGASRPQRGAPRFPYVLAQERSCLATTEILSCHNTHLVLPQQRSCLATTEIVSSQSRDCVFPEYRLCRSRIQTVSSQNTSSCVSTIHTYSVYAEQRFVQNVPKSKRKNNFGSKIHQILI